MFTERTIQYFCSEAQFSAMEGKNQSTPWNLELKPEKRWTEFEKSCEKDEDCPNPDNGQVCTKIHWEATLDGASFSNGEACYNWNSPVCPGSPFGAENYNYENTGWSFYTQYSCTATSGASTLAATAATLIALLNLI